jgi:hypothetical protein
MKLIDNNQREIQQSKKEIIDVNRVVKQKASQEDVEKCVLREEFENSIVTTNLEIQTKTDIPFTEALQSHIQVRKIICSIH